MSEGSRTYFEEVAPRWDALRKSFFSDAVRDKALSAAGVRPGGTAADIGAGSGFITEGLVHRGLRVIAVDRSPAMLDVMRRKFPEPAAVECRLSETDRLPAEDGSVDHVFANMYLHHVESPADSIREMARILKPGGTLVLTDLDTHNFEFLRQEHRDRWMGFPREDVRAWMSGAGLEAVSVDCAGERCCARSTCGAVFADVSIFLASGRKGKPPAPR
jgi:ubiquinone/menaquinone biosynthesis C-methylase UbiE